MTKYLSFYTKEIGYWAIFDTYWTAVTILFLIGWAAYVFIVQRIIAVSLLTYENIYGETLLETLKPFFDNHIVPWFKWVLQFPIFDDFWLELDEERVNQIMQEMDQELENEQSEIARTHLDMDIIAVEVYTEIDPAVKRVMEDTREHNYWWCCMQSASTAITNSKRKSIHVNNVISASRTFASANQPVREVRVHQN